MFKTKKAEPEKRIKYEKSFVCEKVFVTRDYQSFKLNVPESLNLHSYSTEIDISLSDNLNFDFNLKKFLISFQSIVLITYFALFTTFLFFYIERIVN